MIREHYAAVKALLKADSALSTRVEDSARVGKDGLPTRETYAILFGGGPEDLDDGRLTSQQRAISAAEFVYTVRSVAPTPDGARAVATKAFAQLVGATLTIEGRSCRPIRHTGSDPLQPDDSISPPIYYCDDEYTLNSDPS